MAEIFSGRNSRVTLKGTRAVKELRLQHLSPRQILNTIYAHKLAQVVLEGIADVIQFKAVAAQPKKPIPGIKVRLPKQAARIVQREPGKGVLVSKRVQLDEPSQAFFRHYGETRHFRPSTCEQCSFHNSRFEETFRNHAISLLTAAGVRGYRGWFFIPWNVGVTPDGRKVFFEVCRDNQANIETRVSVRNYGHNFPPDKARRLRKIMREYKYLATRLTSKELKKRKNGTTEREEEGK